jgi:uncharacterized protein YjbJ (UPF0337 family)
MNTLEIKGAWNIIRGKFKQVWASLTDDDLRLDDGLSDEMPGRVQKRTGETRATVVKAIQQASVDRPNATVMG